MTLKYHMMWKSLLACTNKVVAPTVLLARLSRRTGMTLAHITRRNLLALTNNDVALNCVVP